MIAVIGAGAWGTALAHTLAAGGRPVRLWARDPQLAATINATRANPRYLPGVPLAATIAASADPADFADCATVLLVPPAQSLGAVLAAMPRWRGDVVVCAKGIEAGSLRLMHEVAAAGCPAATIAVLSGPTFAHEVARALPTAVTLACSGGEPQWERLAAIFGGGALRPYRSFDLVGAEIGGAVKNVLAIAAGVVDGLGLGENARAALISRGFAEMTRFALALGADPLTLTGLSGLGDVMLTCNSPASRNFALGRALGQGATAAEALTARRTVAEGAHTAPVLVALARERGITMPIAEGVAALVSGATRARALADELFARPLRAERDSGGEALLG